MKTWVVQHGPKGKEKSIRRMHILYNVALHHSLSLPYCNKGLCHLCKLPFFRKCQKNWQPVQGALPALQSGWAATLRLLFPEAGGRTESKKAGEWRGSKIKLWLRLWRSHQAALACLQAHGWHQASAFKNTQACRSRGPRGGVWGNCTS